MGFQDLSDFNENVKDRILEVMRTGNDVVFGSVNKNDRIRSGDLLIVTVPGVVGTINGNRVRAASVVVLKPDGTTLMDVNVLMSLNTKVGDKITVTSIKRNRFKSDDVTYDLVTGNKT